MADLLLFFRSHPGRQRPSPGPREAEIAVPWGPRPPEPPETLFPEAPTWEETDA